MERVVVDTWIPAEAIVRYSIIEYNITRVDGLVKIRGRYSTKRVGCDSPDGAMTRANEEHLKILKQGWRFGTNGGRRILTQRQTSARRTLTWRTS